MFPSKVQTLLLSKNLTCENFVSVALSGKAVCKLISMQDGSSSIPTSFTFPETRYLLKNKDETFTKRSHFVSVAVSGKKSYMENKFRAAYLIN